MVNKKFCFLEIKQKISKLHQLKCKQKWIIINATNLVNSDLASHCFKNNFSWNHGNINFKQQKISSYLFIEISFILSSVKNQTSILYLGMNLTLLQSILYMPIENCHWKTINSIFIYKLGNHLNPWVEYFQYALKFSIFMCFLNYRAHCSLELISPKKICQFLRKKYWISFDIQRICKFVKLHEKSGTENYTGTTATEYNYVIS